MSSINSHMLRGSLWAVSMRWSTRVIGLVSTIILARLLVPEDFGIFAMATMVIAFLDLFTELGIGVLLIREPEIDDDDCNTAWTFKILQGLVLSLITLATAPLAAGYFDEPRLIPVMQVLALSPFIAGFQNIGMILVRKELDFAKDFRFIVYQRLIKFVCVISSVLLFMSYWGLVAGQILAALSGLFLSYRMHPYRPRLSLSRWRKFTSFSVLMMLGNSGKYFNNRMDSIVVGGLFSTATLGLYNLAYGLANMAATEIVAPVGRALMPSYSKVSQDSEALVQAFLISFAFTFLLMFPMGLGLAAVSDKVVPVLYGSNWLEAAPILRWLAIYAVFSGLNQILSGHILLTIRHEKLVMYIRYARLAVLTTVVMVFARIGNIEHLARAMAIMSITLVPAHMLILKSVLPVTLAQLVGSIIRPVLAGALMLVSVDLLPDVSGYLALDLLAEVALGATVYAGALFILWALVGQPAGPEAILLDKLRGKMGVGAQT